MAEAEDVIVDAARHATDYAHALWRRHRPRPAGARTWTLADLIARIDLLVVAVFGKSWPIRSARPPASTGLLARVFSFPQGPRAIAILPATDGVQIWLPADSHLTDEVQAAGFYRLLALQQATRAYRGSATIWAQTRNPLEQDLLLLLEAEAADADLVRRLPGLAQPLQALRMSALAARPPLARFSASQQAVEQAVRDRLGQTPDLALSALAEDSLRGARAWAAQLTTRIAPGTAPLFKDQWTGELRAPPVGTNPAELFSAGHETLGSDTRVPRSARLLRAPRVRKAPADEEDATPGAWMVQTSQPHEMAADPMGLQRPTDRDVDNAAEDFAEDLSALAEARQLATPGPAKEVLLSEDPPAMATRRARQASRADTASDVAVFDYPEWDCKAGLYRHPGAKVHVLPAATTGDEMWLQATLARHRYLLAGVRRGFEMLKAERVELRRQLDADDIDLEALVEARADFAAGLPMAQAVYRGTRPARRSLAITLLVDISGSTDSWVAAGRRIIDVEREALLLVCIALEGLREPYSVLAFSGQGAQGVTLRELKRFDEAYGECVALRIAALEPENYTRTGAAVRHAAAGLMHQPVRHRLLLVLSDGKPNDDDEYDGRYGVEDLRQGVAEARLQGISAFCLTIDRQAAGYLRRVFGVHHYTLLREPERLPAALMAWMRRLLSH